MLLISDHLTVTLHQLNEYTVPSRCSITTSVLSINILLPCKKTDPQKVCTQIGLCVFDDTHSVSNKIKSVVENEKRVTLVEWEAGSRELRCAESAWRPGCGGERKEEKP